MEPADRWRVIESRLLDGEKIIYLTEKRHLRAARRAHPDKVVYFPPEIDELNGFRDVPDFKDIVRATHLVKKKFLGWIVPSSGPG